ncbi:urea transporter [Flavobacterium silvisoli]|uniref:Urea transporter n=1 Tax=Flavobacterium silvisoli TaxID=2529433 RepID=A0A4V2L5E0_9FLAO|nr:urea transporter [Flavobacterium silvisoli]TBX70301.1 urea transporter [Flavobacterium silvisoli]
MNATNTLVRATFRGVGQIMLQENAFSGVLFLIGISYGSILMAIGTILAAIIGTTTAYLLKYSTEEIQKGLYGFSPALVGAAVFLFLKPDFISWIVLILGSIGAVLLQHSFITKKIAAFTFPFVWITWVILFGINVYVPQLLNTPTPLVVTPADACFFPFKAFGQIIFQSSYFSGVVFFTGIAINKPIAAVYGFLGALFSSCIAYYLLGDIENIENGLLGYNAVLCAIVFTDTSFKNLKWMMISVLIALAVQLVMMKFNLIVLTFPFVLAAAATLFLKKRYPVWLKQQEKQG